MTEPTQETRQTTREQVQIALRAIEDKKGAAIRVLDVRGKSSITDYLIPQPRKLQSAFEGDENQP